MSSVKMPVFFGIQTFNRANFEAVKSVLVSDFLAAEAPLMLNENKGAELVRVDKGNFLINGRTEMVALWHDPNRPDDPSRMIAIFSKIKQENGTVVVTPFTLIRGHEQPFIGFYKMSCCSSPSAVVAFTQDAQHKVEVRDSVSGVMDEHASLFAKKVFVAESADDLDRLKHLYLEITGTAHDCAHHASYERTTGNRVFTCEPVTQ